MLKFFTVIAFCLILFTTSVKAQFIEERAKKITREMTSSLKLNEGEMIMVNRLNKDKLAQLEALIKIKSSLSARQVDIRIDQIEESYNSQIFEILNSRQYAAFKKFKDRYPEFYDINSRTLYMAFSNTRSR